AFHPPGRRSTDAAAGHIRARARSMNPRAVSPRDARSARTRSPPGRGSMRSIAIAPCVCLALCAFPRAAGADGRPGFTLTVNQVRLYMTHYALFEEPDPTVPPGIYIDATTHGLTDELSLAPPCETLQFSSGQAGTFVAVSPSPATSLPYFVSPPGFPALPAPTEVMAAISGVLGGQISPDVIAANTSPLLVAIGHFEPTPGAISAERRGNRLAVRRDVEFQVKVRIGFRFQPPVGYPLPPVGILTGWLTRGLVDQLIGVPPGDNAGEIVVY